MTIEEYEKRYTAAAHAVQSGVAQAMHTAGMNDAHLPKHLRAGLDLRAADAGALAKLLIEKGIISSLEYHRAMALGAEAEKARYEEALSQAMGVKITLA